MMFTRLSPAGSCFTRRGSFAACFRRILPLLGAWAGAAPIASAQVTLASPSVEERQADAGGGYTGTLRLENPSGEPQEVLVSQSDYQFHADGRTLYADKGSTARSNAGWISVTPTRFIVPAKSRATVSYRVAVPAKGVAGTYWSLLLVETIPAGTPGSSRKLPRGVRAEVGIRSRLRYAVQIATHVGSGGSRRMTFARPNAVRSPNGTAALEVDVLNAGELGCRPQIALELYDQRGTLVRRLEQQRGLVYPGSSVRQRFDLGPVRQGAYRALVTVDTGDQEVFGAQYNLKL